MAVSWRGALAGGRGFGRGLRSAARRPAELGTGAFTDGNGAAWTSTLTPMIDVLLAGLLALALPQSQSAAPDKLPSGVEITVLRAGTGARPVNGDVVALDYVARQPDGTVVDRRPASQPGRMFVGSSNPRFWEEVLPLLAVGGTYRIVVPPAAMWPDVLWPEGVPKDARITYEASLREVVRPPEFAKPDPDQSHDDDAGFRYQVLAAGDGALPRAEDWLEVHYALWDAEGHLVENTRFAGQPLRMRADTVPSPFLKRAPLLMRPGARWRCAMKVGYAFGRPHPTLEADALTYWDITLVRVTAPLPLPEFVRPTPADLTSTPSGLRYQILEEGAGTPPTEHDRVRVHFVAWLEDGRAVDSSYAHGRPTEMAVARATPGLGETLRLMRPGGVFRVVMAPELAYGKEGVPGIVPPDATVIYRVELVEVMR